MKKITTFLLSLLLVIPAMANVTGGTYYLKPNSNWTKDGARFAIYYWIDGGASKWVSMTAVEGDNGVYGATIPAGTYGGMIFCRMNGGASANNWNNKWNQTGDITENSGSHNCVTINSGQWDCGSNYTWSTYTPPVVGEPSVSFTYSPDVVYVNDVVTFKATVKDVADGYTVVYSVDGNVLSGNTWTPTAKGSYNVTATVKLNGTDVVSTSNTIQVLVDGLYIKGTMNNWGESEDYFMPKGEDGKYSWTGDFEDGVEFKITHGGEWLTADQQITDAGTFALKDGGNTIWKGGNKNLTITIDAAIKNMTIAINTVVVFESLTFTVTVPEGTNNCYIIGSFPENNWATPIEMNKVEDSDIQYTITIDNLDRTSVKYKYVTNAETNASIWDNEEVADENDGHVDSRSYSEEDVVVKWKGIALYYDENIVCEQCYFLDPGGNGLWDQAGAWFAAYFLNKNTDAYTWVIGEQLENRKVMFYLSKYNVPGATRATEDPVYTHVIFCRMNPKYDTMGWNNELPEGSEDRVWNNTADLAWDETKSYLYKITGWGANEGYWEAGATGIEAVETAGGIVYAGNVVTAEGAIYVYNLSGAVVAYGEDNLDLRGLNSGVYVVRNGNNALKVVR